MATDTAAPGDRWYDLFSRGARDWLRHNQKIREAVRASLPEVIANADLRGDNGGRTVQVPVRFLEHYRFRLRPPQRREGVGQGQVKPGEVLRQPQPQGGQGQGGAGSGEGGVEFVVEMTVDDIVDWLWQELQLPNLKAKAGAMTEDDYSREGWDRRGARARLDRRRTLREAIKRRAVQPEGPAFTNDELRYRQLVRRDRPTTQAVVLFAMDVSSSMTERDRRLAKTFFFWVVQGLRRQYQHLDTVFVAHTVSAWEFDEREFFQVRGQGGTVASTAFGLALDIIASRYDPARYNVYLFYASDGENFQEDRSPAGAALGRLGACCSFMGYVEVDSGGSPGPYTETAALFDRLRAAGHPADRYALTEETDVWEAIRAFFNAQAEPQAALEP